MNKERISSLIIVYFNKFTFKEEILLLKRFKSYSNIIKANFNSLTSFGLNEKKANEFKIFVLNFQISKECSFLKNENIKYICRFEDEYPILLKEIYNSPLVLFYKGNLHNLESKFLAVVGSRNYSLYGEQAAKHIVSNLKNITIVSGLAIGIDSFAHHFAINNNLTTIAILGSGLDRKSIYPKCNFPLADLILKNNGLLISEFPPFTPPLKQNFPRRNRLISGLCQATLVIEAREKSGSLITANYALEQNREVFAIPANIFSKFSKGSNKLIKLGATPINDASELNEFFNSA